MANEIPVRRLKKLLNEAEYKAWKSLSREKFQMFGYWAAIWVYLNRIGNFKRSNPFTVLVRTAIECERSVDIGKDESPEGGKENGE